MDYKNEVTLRLRVSPADAHYEGGLVGGAHLIQLFTDAGTLLNYARDRDSALAPTLSGEFLAPVYAGDYLEIRARVTHVGNRSRKREYEAWVIARSAGVGERSSTGEVLSEPVLAARGAGVSVVPRDVWEQASSS